MKNVKYVHREDFHNLNAANEIVPVIIDLVKPNSVVDIGCGIGTFLFSFKEKGISNVLGVDGSWVDKNLLNKYLNKDEFLAKDLEQPLQLPKKFDLVISLEVAEHLSENSANIFVKNLISAGPVILFSCAIPFQGGQNHINEQWIDYWERKFNKYDFVIHDVIRPIFWDNPNVDLWYKQNMVLVANKDFKFEKEVIYNPLKNVVHPDLFIQKGQKSDSLTSARPLNFRLFLISVFGYSFYRKLRSYFSIKKN